MKKRILLLLRILLKVPRTFRYFDGNDYVLDMCFYSSVLIDRKDKHYFLNQTFACYFLNIIVDIGLGLYKKNAIVSFFVLLKLSCEDR